MSMTLSKLAKLANVSVSTASKAFSMSREVNEETREMIFRIAKENGCFKHFFKAKYPRPVVAVLCPELHSRYYAILVRYIQEELEKNGMDVCVSTYAFQQDIAHSQFDYYERYTSVDAVVSIGARPLHVSEREIPTVVCGTEHVCDGADVSVCFEARDVLEEVIALCMEQGRRDIAFIGEPLTRSRRQAVERVLQTKYGYEQVRCAESTQRFEDGGYEAFEQLLADGGVPQAVICAYDSMAYGVLRGAHEHGIRVPEELFVVGYNNLPQSAYTIPSLTSVDFNGEKMAKTVARLLQDLFAGTPTPREISVPAFLVCRESTGPV